MKRLLFAALAALAGARHVLRGKNPIVLPVIAAFAVLAVLLLVFRPAQKAGSRSRTMAIAALLFCLFALRTEAVCTQWRLAEEWTVSQPMVQATLVRPMVRSAWRGFKGSQEWYRGRFCIRTPGRTMDVQLTLPERLACGTTIRFSGGKLHPGEPRPGSGQLDVRAWMHADNIRLQGRLERTDYQQRKSTEQTMTIRLGKRKEAFATRMESAFGQDAVLVAGMVFGDTAGLTADTQARLERLGIRHLLAVSGFHVGIVYGLALIVCAATGIRGWPRCLVLSGLLAGFTVLTGVSASTCRAALVLSLYGFAEWLQWEKSFSCTLLLSALILVFWRPAMVLDLGFALSYSAALGMVVLSPLCQSLLRSRAFGVGAAAWLGALPAACAFHQASLLGFLLTPLFSLFLVVVLPGVLCAFCCPLSAIGDVLLMGCAPFVRALRLCLDGLSGWGPGGGFSRFFVFRLPDATPLRCVLYGTTLSVLAWMQTKAPDRMPPHRRVLCGVTMACLVLLMALPLCVLGLEATFVNVGQGDCIWVGYHDFDMLVDTGTEQAGRKAVLPFLESRGIRSVDLLVVTHLDSDHSGGLNAVLDGVRVEHVWFSADARDALETGEQGILEELATRRIPYGYHRACEHHQIRDLRIDVIGPPAKARERSANEGSLVLRLSLDGFILDLTGDTEGEALAALDLAAPEEAAVVVKAPHHGSKNALIPSAYADQHADVVVFSCGRNNRYGHPHPDVLAYWKRCGARLLRTDRDGEIRLRYRGGALRIVRGLDLWYTV